MPFFLSTPAARFMPFSLSMSAARFMRSCGRLRACRAAAARPAAAYPMDTTR